jgi:formamidopyrimidine-DNA glycosylase
MPELPEVETIRRQLEPELRSRRIERLEVLDARWTRPVKPRQVEEQVNGRTIESLRRRGKYLLMDLEGGITLVMHLRMTGNLLLVDEGDLVAAVDCGSATHVALARRSSLPPIASRNASRAEWGSSRSPSSSPPTRSSGSPRGERRR